MKTPNTLVRNASSYMGTLNSGINCKLGRKKATQHPMKALVELKQS